MQREIELITIDQSMAVDVTAMHVVHLTGFSGCVAVFYADNVEYSRLVYCDNSKSINKSLNDIVKSFHLYKAMSGIDDILDVKVKFIASGDFYTEVESFFKSQGVNYKAKCVDDGFYFDVYYYNEQQKLRISKVGAKQTVDSREKLKILIVDDSTTIRRILRNLLQADPSFEVVAEADTPSKVIPLIKQHKPDVITLDINMPEKNGVELLEEYYPIHKVPTIVVTSLNISEGTLILDALEKGAIDYIQKPSLKDLEIMGPILREKVMVASKTNTEAAKKPEAKSDEPYKIKPLNSAPVTFDEGGLVAIGASTGGTEAIRNLLIGLPDNIPPIVIAQHIPEYFSNAFADRLNQLCGFKVKEAQHEEEIVPGCCYIAPGGKNMRVIERDKKYYADITEENVGSQHRPCVDYLFRSVAKLSNKSVGVILTGMGSDGARGLLEMRKKGCITIGQSQETCVVFGMPKVAYEIGALDKVLDLNDISQEICEQVKMLNRAS